MSTGVSHDTYFGGRTPSEQIIYVLRSDIILAKGTQVHWEVSWNTGRYPRRFPRTGTIRSSRPQSF
jgi:hypothetical protein